MPKARHGAEELRREEREHRQARKNARRVLRLAKRRITVTPKEE
jgi:hypothetical protein